MKNLIKRFVVIWIVLAIAWLIGKMVAGCDSGSFNL